jgi:hypothetical protein
MARDLSDEELLERLGVISRIVDPVPPEVAERSRIAFEFRDLESQLAALVSDSSEDLAAVRGHVRGELILEFSVGELSIDVEITRLGVQRSVIGQVRGVALGPGASIAAEWSSDAASHRAPVDEQGRFFLSDLPAGRFRLRLERTGEPSVLTEWITSLVP